MALNNEQLNRLNKISSILTKAGNGAIDSLQNQNQQEINKANEILSAYYTDTNTGKIAQAYSNSKDSATLDASMKAIGDEISGLDVAGAKTNIKGLSDINDSTLDYALGSFKKNAGTFIATSTIRGHNALEQQQRTNTFTGIDSLLQGKYKTYAESASSIGDITNATQNFAQIFDDLSVQDLKASGIMGTDEDLEKLLGEYKTANKEKWDSMGLMYMNDMQKSKISSDFSNSLNVDFTINHAPEVYSMDGATSYDKAKEMYASNYEKNQMDIADPMGLQRAGTKLGDTSVWAYASDSWLYNFGYNITDDTTGDVESQMRAWADGFFSQVTSMSEDEKKILVDKFISDNIDPQTGGIKTDGVVADGMVDTCLDSQRKAQAFLYNTPELANTGEGILEQMKQAGMDPENNPYERQIATNIISSKFGFQISSDSLAYADELGACREIIPTISSMDLNAYSYGTVEANGETYGTQYYSYIDNVYKAYIEKNGIEDTPEYKYGFFKAFDEAILSGTMSLSSTTTEKLKEASKTMTEQEYTNYVGTLQMSGAFPSNYAYRQALELAPVSEYKEEQTKVESIITDTLSNIDKDMSAFYMKGIAMYPQVRKEVQSALQRFGGDITSKDFTDWLKNYIDTLVTSYNSKFEKKEYENILKGMGNYGADEDSSETYKALTSDTRKVLSDYKQGKLDSLVNHDVVSQSLASITGNEYIVDYDDLCQSAYETLFPYSDKKYKDASTGEKSQVMLNIKVATLLAEEQRRVETTFSQPMNTTITPVKFEGGKQAYVLGNGLVIWSDSIYDNTYNVGMLRPEIKPEDYDLLHPTEFSKSTLLLEDIDNYDIYQRTSQKISTNIGTDLQESRESLPDAMKSKDQREFLKLAEKSDDYRVKLKNIMNAGATSTTRLMAISVAKKELGIDSIDVSSISEEDAMRIVDGIANAFGISPETYQVNIVTKYAKVNQDPAFMTVLREIGYSKESN